MPAPPTTLPQDLEHLLSDDGCLNAKSVESYAEDDNIPAAECRDLVQKALAIVGSLLAGQEKPEWWAEVQGLLGQAHNRAIQCENSCVGYDPEDTEHLEQEWQSVQETLLAAISEAAVQAAYWRGRNEAQQ